MCGLETVRQKGDKAFKIEALMVNDAAAAKIVESGDAKAEETKGFVCFFSDNKVATADQPDVYAQMEKLSTALSHDNCLAPRFASEIMKSETTPEGEPTLVPYDTLKGVKLTDPKTKKTEFCYKADEAMIHRTTIKSFTQGLESFAGIAYEIRICGFEIRFKSKDRGARQVKILDKSDERL